MSTKLLNLDELPTPEDVITVRYKGVDYVMREMTLADYIEQEKRQAAVNQAHAENDSEGAMALMQDQLVKMFPGIPAGDMPLRLVLQIFNWLTEMSAEITKASAPTEGEGVTSGNEPTMGEIPTTD